VTFVVSKHCRIEAATEMDSPRLLNNLASGTMAIDLELDVDRAHAGACLPLVPDRTSLFVARLSKDCRSASYFFRR